MNQLPIRVNVTSVSSIVFLLICFTGKMRLRYQDLFRNQLPIRFFTIYLLIITKNDIICLTQNSCTTSGVKTSTKLLPNINLSGARDLCIFLSNLLVVLPLHESTHFWLAMFTLAADENVCRVNAKFKRYTSRNMAIMGESTCSKNKLLHSKFVQLKNLKNYSFIRNLEINMYYWFAILLIPIIKYMDFTIRHIVKKRVNNE